MLSSSLALPCSHRLWRRSCWLFIKVLLSLVASWLFRFHFHGGEHYLRFDPAGWEPFVRMFDTDFCWHLAAVEIWVASVLPGLFLQPHDYTHDVFALHGGVAAFVGVALLSKRQVLLILFRLLLKTALSLALVRFWCFLVHSIHSGTFLFKTAAQRVVRPGTSINQSINQSLNI